MASSGGGNAAGEEAVEDEGGRSVEDRRDGSCEKRYEPESADHYGGRTAEGWPVVLFQALQSAGNAKPKILVQVKNPQKKKILPRRFGGIAKPT